MREKRCFDARLEAPLRGTLSAAIVFRRTEHPAVLTPYAAKGDSEAAHWARVCAELPFDPKWGDEFTIHGGPQAGPRGGKVLLPRSPEPEEMRLPRRMSLLGMLGGDEKDMVLALAEAGGVAGAEDETILELSHISRTRLEATARDLEMEGRARILSFAPLTIVSQASLDFLADRIVAALDRFHAGHPDRAGMPLDDLREKAAAPPLAFTLALKTLEKDGRVKTEDGAARRAEFVRVLTPQDRKIMDELEAMAFRGGLEPESLQDLRRRYKIGPQRLEELLSELAVQRKIVRGPDNFLVKAEWLDGLVARLRERFPRRTLMTVADFKEITGLSRKFAIPLLELLDSLGVTRRVGDSREVLPAPRKR